MSGSRHNIVWFLIDGIRRYPTDKDLRGKLPMMERFGEHSVEFLNVVTSAPSTIMSISAMMTSLPAYFIARNYDDFRFDNTYLVCLNDLLKRNQYSSYAFLRGPETREKLRGVLDPVPRRFWAAYLRHGFKWTNQDLNLVLERVLQDKIPRPAFLFFHYNPQTPCLDPATSDTVEQALHFLLNSGFDYDNTVYVVSSDHGFPDPSTGITTEWEIEHKLTHDLLLTDDNIMIPLYLRYPGCRPRKIEETVSSLDIMPTLLELVGIPVDGAVPYEIKGRSLLALVETGKHEFQGTRYFRCDARLMYQTGRITAIRDQSFKYARFHDQYALPHYAREGSTTEAFYDLATDPLEKQNLIASRDLGVQQKLLQFRAEFERLEREAFACQSRYLVHMFHSRVFGRGDRCNVAESLPGTILVAVQPGTGSYGQIATEVVGRAYPSAAVDLLIQEGHVFKSDPFCYRRVLFYRCDPVTGDCTFEDAESPLYNLVIVLVTNPAQQKSHKFVRFSKRFRGNQVLVLDCNMNVFKRRRYWYYRLRALLNRAPYFKEEPSLLWRELVIDTRHLCRYLLRLLGRLERWSA